jgi:hypothetical protein
VLTTWEIVDTSIPRAAMSVATRIWKVPSRKPSRAACRRFWERFPWMDAAL